jgi:hypothetical protein
VVAEVEAALLQDEAVVLIRKAYFEPHHVHQVEEVVVHLFFCLK